MTINKIYQEIDAAFEQSDIKKIASDLDQEWNYSLSSTRIHHNSPLLVGFNWGASTNEKYQKQSCPPDKSFKEQELGSFARFIPFLDKYYSSEEIEHIVQTNFCFFRSPLERDITPGDRDRCFPIFMKFLDLITPSEIISFSTSFRKYIMGKPIFLKKYAESIKTNKGNLSIIGGHINISSQKIPINFLPHPNYPINSEFRKKAWEILISNK